MKAELYGDIAGLVALENIKDQNFSGLMSQISVVAGDRHRLGNSSGKMVAGDRYHLTNKADNPIAAGILGHLGFERLQQSIGVNLRAA